MLGVTGHFSNYILLFVFPTKKAIVPTLPFVVTDIGNFRSRVHTDRAFMPTLKLDCDLNYLDVACCIIMVYSLGYTAQFTVPCTHNQLAKIEPQWAALADSATAMLQHAYRPIKYWLLAMSTVVYLRNRLSTSAVSGGFGGVPYIILHGVPTDLAYVEVFV
jgi:hypothetical protein